MDAFGGSVRRKAVARQRRRTWPVGVAGDALLDAVEFAVRWRELGSKFAHLFNFFLHLIVRKVQRIGNGLARVKRSSVATNVRRCREVDARFLERPSRGPGVCQFYVLKHGGESPGMICAELFHKLPSFAPRNFSLRPLDHEPSGGLGVTCGKLRICMHPFDDMLQGFIARSGTEFSGGLVVHGRCVHCLLSERLKPSRLCRFHSRPPDRGNEHPRPRMAGAGRFQRFRSGKLLADCQREEHKPGPIAIRQGLRCCDWR